MSTTLEAVAELIRTQKLRIEITSSVGYWVKAPCLLVQLREAIAVGGETGGRGIPTSRAPINTDAADLWYEIVYTTFAWANHLNLSRRDPHPESATPWIGRLLRHTAATAISKAMDPVADRIETNARRWTNQINTMLTGHTDQRGVRGATCPNCAQATILEDRPSDGLYRIPAIVLVSRDTLRWLVCQACGWTDPIVGPAEVIHTVGVFDAAGQVAL